MPRLLPMVLSAFVASACVSPHPEIQMAVEGVDRDRLMGHVESLCAIGPRPAGDQAATAGTLEYLEQELRSYGYEPRRKEFFAWTRVYTKKVDEAGRVTFEMTGQRRVHPNLIVEHRGVIDPDTVVELGAHYDTVPFGPGADDNTSGVAAALEVARMVKKERTHKTIRIVFFAMEEDGKIGSREYVKQLVASGDVPEGMLSLDGVGYTSNEPDSQDAPIRIPLLFSPPTVGNFILVAGNWDSGWLGNVHENCIETYVPELPYYSVNRLAAWFGDSDRGDHYRYWEAGIPSIAIVDGMDYRNPHYHLKTDVPATLDPVFLQQNTQAALATMLTWAGIADAEKEPQ